MATTSEFVSQKLSLLAADVHLTPEQVDVAWRRVQQQQRRVPRRLSIGMGAGLAAALTLVLLMPSTRALAQSVWKSLLLSRAEPLSLDMEKTSIELLMPNVFPLHSNGESWRTSDLAEAEKLAGFHIATLASPGRPSFRVEQQPEITRVVDLAGIRRELANLGRPMVPEPYGIDGAKIVLRPRGRLVVTSYGECPQIKGMWRACAFLVQSRPKALELPPNVSLEPFVQFSLELAGLSTERARELQALVGADPVIFLPNEAGSTVETVTVKGHRGVLVRNSGNAAHVLQWQDGEFHFELHVRDADRAVELAETAR